MKHRKYIISVIIFLIIFCIGYPIIHEYAHYYTGRALGLNPSIKWGILPGNFCDDCLNKFPLKTSVMISMPYILGLSLLLAYPLLKKKVLKYLGYLATVDITANLIGFLVSGLLFYAFRIKFPNDFFNIFILVNKVYPVAASILLIIAIYFTTFKGIRKEVLRLWGIILTSFQSFFRHKHSR